MAPHASEHRAGCVFSEPGWLELRKGFPNSEHNEFTSHSKQNEKG